MASHYFSHGHHGLDPPHPNSPFLCRMDLWPFAWKQRPLKLLLRSRSMGTALKPHHAFNLLRWDRIPPTTKQKGTQKLKGDGSNKRVNFDGQIWPSNFQDLSTLFERSATSWISFGSPDVGKTALGEGIWEVGAVARPGEKTQAAFPTIPNHTSHRKKRRKIMGWPIRWSSLNSLYMWCKPYQNPLKQQKWNPLDNGASMLTPNALAWYFGTTKVWFQ